MPHWGKPKQLTQQLTVSCCHTIDNQSFRLTSDCQLLIANYIMPGIPHNSSASHTTGQKAHIFHPNGSGVFSK